MRNVFVTQNEAKRTWKVIDPKTNKLIEEVDDVLLFKAVYKRHKDVKGWHGTLSETINPYIVDLMDLPFAEIVHVPKRYYPRLTIGTESPVKEAAFLHLKDNKMFRRVGYVNIEEYTQDWFDEPEEDSDEE